MSRLQVHWCRSPSENPCDSSQDIIKAEERKTDVQNELLSKLPQADPPGKVCLMMQHAARIKSEERRAPEENPSALISD